MSEQTYGPSPAASVILHLSERIGALIIDTDADLTGVEIEISPVASDGPHVHRTHSMVRERLTEPRQFSAVYPSLEAGDYTIWRNADTPVATVTIHGGSITRHTWTAA
jgi:hypothetical protein